MVGRREEGEGEDKFEVKEADLNIRQSVGEMANLLIM